MEGLGRLSIAVAALLLAPHAALATPVAGGVCDDGGTVEFFDISSTANFGAGECIGNNLDYDPFGFFAEVSPGPGTDTTNGQLNFTIRAKSGNFVEELRIRERGDYSVSTSGVGGSEARADLFVFITVVESEFMFPLHEEDDQQTVVFTAPVNAAGIWSLESDLDITQLLIDAGIFNTTGRAIEVEVAVNNVLNAQADTDNSALIAKKDAKGFVITVVPEPTTALLLGLGLSGLAWQGRRR